LKVPIKNNSTIGDYKPILEVGIASCKIQVQKTEVLQFLFSFRAFNFNQKREFK
jgi:hypothetical protein